MNSYCGRLFMLRCTPLTMPAETLLASPRGLPIAITLVSHLDLITVADFYCGQRTASIDFQDCKFGPTTSSKQLPFERGAIGECNVDFVRVLNNVPVRNDKPAGIYN